MSLLPLPDLIDVPEAPAIPGLLFRHFRGESDYPAMVRLTNERAAFNGDEYNMTIEELADDYKPGEHFDPANDILLAEVDGALAGFWHVRWWDEENGPRIYRWV